MAVTSRFPADGLPGRRQHPKSAQKERQETDQKDRNFGSGFGRGRGVIWRTTFLFRRRFRLGLERRILLILLTTHFAVDKMVAIYHGPIQFSCAQLKAFTGRLQMDRPLSNVFIHFIQMNTG